MISRRESCLRIRRGPWPQPKRWSPFGSMGVPHGQRGAGLEEKVGRPSQILVATMNSLGGIERPKLGMGGARSQQPVSLLPARVDNLALP